MPNEEFHQHYLNATVSENSIYISLLKDAVEKEGVCNIAVTGPYGSGKTTVINTFLQHNPQYKVLRISLAKLEESSKNKDDLEFCILQQMFYQAKGCDIPNSRFNRIICLSKIKQISYTILIMVCVLAFAWFKWKYAILDCFDTAMESLVSILISVFFFVALCVGLFFLVHFLVSKFGKINIKQLVLDKLQLNISTTNEHNALNKYLDEILYYFKMKTIDIVVFEDLDRYEDPDIFIKLRELNAMLNHSEDLEIKKITFIYALKDGLLGKEPEQLVKFFDYILPVIPYVNVSNSGDKMIDILQKSGYIKEENKSIIDSYEDLDKNFINDFSPYIKDMRVIYNICNEYEVYRKIQKGLNYQNLMAMTVYKNLYPKEFDKIYSGEGTICEIFNLENKEAWQEERKNAIEGSLPELQNKIKIARDEFMKDEKELHLTMIAAFIKLVSCHDKCKPYGYNQISDLFDNSAIYNNMISGGLGYTDPRYPNHGPFYISLSKIEAAVSPSFNYHATLQSIQNKMSRPERERDRLQSELNSLSRNTMEKMCENPEILKKLEDKTKNEPILYNFIRKGYINENYDLYISLFHEGDITQEENIFVITVKKNQSTRDLQSLINVESVIKRLNDEDFNHVGTLQFQIALFLSEHYKEYKKQADGLFQQMELVSRESRDLLMDLLSLNKSIEHTEEFLCLFIHLVSKAWKKYFDIDFPTPEEAIFTFLNVIFGHANIDDIKDLDGDKHYVAKYVSEQTNYEDLFVDLDESWMKQVLNILPLHIKNLKNGKNKLLNELLITRNLYDITPENIQFVLQFNELINVLQIKSANYTTILASDNESLKKYIEEHFQEYLHNVFFAIPENTAESEDVVLKIIQKDSLTQEDKVKAIIQQKKMRIQDIQNIVGLKEYWKEIVPEHVLLNQRNFETFYASNGMRETTESWMKNTRDVQLFLENLTTISSTLISYYTAVLEDSSISITVFELLVNNDAVAKCLPEDLSKYDEKHLLAIAKSRAVAFSKEKYDQLLVHNDVIKIYVLNHIDEFIEALKADLISMSAPLVYNLFCEDTVSEYRSVIISKMKDTDVNKDSSVILIDYYISDPKAELNKTILKSVITQCEDGIQRKIFIKILAEREEIAKDEIFSIIGSLGEPYSDILSSKTPIRIPYDAVWYEIASTLKSRGFIRDREHRSKTDYLSISKN